jgi:hypothetical protein
MEEIPMNEFRRQIGEYVNQAYYANKAFVLIKGQKKLAALVPMAQLERLAQLEALVNEWQTSANLDPIPPSTLIEAEGETNSISQG